MTGNTKKKLRLYFNNVFLLRIVRPQPAKDREDIPWHPITHGAITRPNLHMEGLPVSERKFVAIVDAYSAANQYAPEILSRGYSAIHIQSASEIPPSLKPTF